MMKYWSIVFAALVIMAGAASFAQDCLEYSHFIRSRGHLEGLPGACRVDLWNDTACIAREQVGLTLIDISDPDHPVEGETLEIGQGFDVCVQGDVAYLAAGYYKLLAIDLTTLAMPMIPDVTDSSWSARSLAVEGNLACILIRDHGVLMVYGLDDPLAPELLAQTEVFGSAMDVAMDEGLIYVTKDTEGLSIYQYSHDTGLQERFDQFFNFGREIAVLDGFAYVSDIGPLVRIFDVRDLDDVQLVAELETDWPVSDLATSPDRLYLYLDNWDGHGLTVMDLSDPTQPRPLALEASYTSHFASGVVRGDLACAVPRDLGIQVIDLRYEVSPPSCSQLPAPARIDWMVMADECAVAFLPDLELIQLYDVSDPATMVAAGSLAQPVMADLVADGSLALMVDFPTRVVDLSDIQNPVELSTFEPAADRATLDNGLAFFGDQNYWGLDVWDLTDPAHPQRLAEVPTDRQYRWLLADGDRLYLGTRTFELEIHDITDPTSPTLLSRTEVDHGVSIADLRDGMLAVSYWYTMRMIDVSDPTVPVVYPIQDTAGRGEIAFMGDDVCMAGPIGVTLMDVTDPAAVMQRAFIPLDDAATYALVANEEAFFVGGAENLWSGYPACGVGVAVPEQLPEVGLRLTASPNPFNPKVWLSLELPVTGEAEVSVYDLAGRRVADLHHGPAETRLYLTWDGCDHSGRAMPAGVYLVRAMASGEAISHKIALVR